MNSSIIPTSEITSVPSYQNISIGNSTDLNTQKPLEIKLYVLILIILGLVLLIFLFYYFCLRPSKNKRKIHKMLLEAKIEEG